MPTDKSLFYYGSLYHKLFDPSLEEATGRVAELIPAGSSVLDIACGTGQLCAALAEKRDCRVTGIDLSLRMLAFARASHGNKGIGFLHADATDLGEMADGSFDYASILFLLHELDMAQRKGVIAEALRVAERVVIVDSITPFPRSLVALDIRFAEATWGRSHHGNFLDFLASGGIDGVIADWPSPLSVEQRLTLGRGCRDLALIAGG